MIVIGVNLLWEACLVCGEIYSNCASNIHVDERALAWRTHLQEAL